MELLSDDLGCRLPPLHGQEAEAEPLVYCCFRLPGTPLAWYVCEGEPEGDDYLFFGFVTAPEPDFHCFLLSELQALRGPQDQEVERDIGFAEGRLTDVVPAPDI
jgi:hypothetical protein